MKNHFRWQRGRQQTGYEKMLLCTANWPRPFDVYLLRFKPGHAVPAHTDKVASGKHYRFNLVLKNAAEGGQFICANPIFETTRIKFFRPDITEHQVTEIVSGTRYVFSVGWIKRS